MSTMGAYLSVIQVLHMDLWMAMPIVEDITISVRKLELVMREIFWRPLHLWWMLSGEKIRAGCAQRKKNRINDVDSGA